MMEQGSVLFDGYLSEILWLIHVMQQTITMKSHDMLVSFDDRPGCITLLSFEVSLLRHILT